VEISVVVVLTLLYTAPESFKAQWSLYVPPGLIFNSSAFRPHCVFMCFVWI